MAYSMTPYRRGAFQKGYRYPKRAYGGRGRPRRYPMYRTPGSFASRVRAVVKAESKYKYLPFEADPTITSPFVHRISAIALGNLSTERIGNWIQPTSLYGTVRIFGNNDSEETTDGVRVGCLVWNNDNDSDAFDATNLLEFNEAPGGPFKIPEKGSFTILWTRYVQVVNNDDNAQFVKNLKLSVSMIRKPKILFDGGENKKFQVFFFALTDTPGLSETPPHIEGDLTLRFTDS